ncbi:hypothetical protein [Kibdelosporangium philippinense]|uniref:hypothetical protein n=1 Tax=Kibdelosporangium philippinense TaxID=211113 RepID=UPI00361781F0
MQSALPGFRGRIATIPQGPGEGGTNLFMSPEIIERLALRGLAAGNTLRLRFTSQHSDEADGYTRTDRYRWIRLRLALRELREISFQADARAVLYKDRTAHYPIPRRWLIGSPGRRSRPWSSLMPQTSCVRTTTSLRWRIPA